METKNIEYKKLMTSVYLSGDPYEDLIERKSTGDSSDSENENSIIIIDSSTDSPKKKNSIRDFDIINLLGKGSYAKVVLSKNIYTNKFYALKIIDKEFLRLVSIYLIIIFNIPEF